MRHVDVVDGNATRKVVAACGYIWMNEYEFN